MTRFFNSEVQNSPVKAVDVNLFLKCLSQIVKAAIFCGDISITCGNIYFRTGSNSLHGLLLRDRHVIRLPQVLCPHCSLKSENVFVALGLFHCLLTINPVRLTYLFCIICFVQNEKLTALGNTSLFTNDFIG